VYGYCAATQAKNISAYHSKKLSASIAYLHFYLGNKGKTKKKKRARKTKKSNWSAPFKKKAGLKF